MTFSWIRDMTITRRQLFKAAPAIPLLGMIGSRYSYHAYSAASKVGPWIGWLQNKSGEVVAFVTRTGRISWMRPLGGFWDKW